MLHSLLPEIQEKVLAYLSSTDLKYLALTNSQYNDFSKPFLFRTVKIPASALFEGIDDTQLEHFHFTKILHLDGFDSMSEQFYKSIQAMQCLEELYISLQTTAKESDFNQLCQCLTGIKCLTFNPPNGVNNEMLKHVKELTGLEQLTLHVDDISFRGISYLSCMTSLKTLYCECCDITTDSCTLISDLVNLEELGLVCCNLSDLSISHLTLLPRLKALDISGNEATDSACRDVTQLHCLEMLSLMSTKISDLGLSYISKLYKTLKKLDVSCCEHVTDAGCEDIALLSRLEQLGICECNITDLGLRTLSALYKLKRLYATGCEEITSAEEGSSSGFISKLSTLTDLDLSATNTCDVGFSNICNLSTLKLLDVGYCNGITHAGCKDIVKLSRLEELNLRLCMITNESLKAIASLSGLRKLCLCDCSNITDSGFGYLCGLRHLEDLNVGCTSISDFGLMQLSYISSLKRLDVSSCHAITDEGCKYLCQLRNLKELNISRCRVTASCIPPSVLLRKNQWLGAVM